MDFQGEIANQEANFCVVLSQVACRTGAICLRLQASGGECEASAERESRATGWTRPNPIARDSRSAQNNNACSAGYVTGCHVCWTVLFSGCVD